MRATPVAAIALVFAFGCGEAGEEQSAGWRFESTALPDGSVHAVNIAPADGGGGPMLTLEEELRIGSIDEVGPTSFGSIKGLAVAEDGRIAVFDSQAQELRIFDASGTHLATYGGRGDGPGEMQDGYGLMQADDGTLWVPDHGNGRMSVFDFDEGFLRSYPLIVLSFGLIWDGVMAEDGTILEPSVTISGDETPRLLRVYDLELNLLDSLPLKPYPEVDREDPPSAFHFKMELGEGFLPVPFYPQTQELVDPSGEMWTTAYADPSYRIARWSPGGDTTLVLETRRPPIPVQAADRDSAISRIQDQLKGIGAPPVKDFSKIPEYKAAVLGLFVDDLDRLWVRTSTLGSGAEFDIYERDGRRVGGVVTALRIWAPLAPVIHGDHLWAVVTDDLGVAYVIRAKLVGTERLGGGP